MEALKNIKTYMLWIMIICSSGYGLFVASVFKPYGGEFDASFLALIGSLGAVVNGFC